MNASFVYCQELEICCSLFFSRVPIDETQYVCKCTEGYALQADGKTCKQIAPAHIPRTSDVTATGNNPSVSKHTGESTDPYAGGMNVGTIAAIAASAVLIIGLVIAVVSNCHYLTTIQYIV